MHVDLSKYRLNDASRLLTPCLLVYPQAIEHNIAEAIRIAGEASRLRPHVKTHKTAEIVDLERAAGITKHKCATLAEAAMLARCGAADVLLAYPLTQPGVSRFVELIKQYPATQFSTVVDSLAGVAALSDAVRLPTASSTADVCLQVLIDVDTGMHRTGVPPGEPAFKLAKAVQSAAGLQFAGLHIYDGQNHQPDRREREAAVNELMQSVWKLVGRLINNGIKVDKLVCGGTPTFPVFADMVSPQPDCLIELSPGTCILGDYNYASDYADMSGFHYAAILLTRVISKPHSEQNLLTLDLGYKAVASDPPAERRFKILDLPDARIVQHSEEHVVIETHEAESIPIGTPLFAIPAHVCPTVALHSEMYVVESGLVRGSWTVAARNRLYTEFSH